MRYLGGKSRDAKRLAAVIDTYRQPGQLVWDPFCGGLSMAVALSVRGPVFASDIHPPLISLYQCVRAGWVPPSVEMSDAQYAAARRLPDWHPRKAFVGYGVSFGGKWFGGRARVSPSHRTPYEQSASAGLLRDVPAVARFGCIDFLAVRPRPTGAILYLDPPYRGTTSYAGTPPFDHGLFMLRAQGWAAHTLVFVSEYEGFPIGREVAAIQTGAKSRLRQGAVERLYLVGGE